MLTHNVRVNQKVSVAHAEVLLTGRTLEALKVVYFVLHTHCHLICSDPLVTGCTKSILTKKSEIVPPAELSTQFIVQPSPHFPESATTQVTTQTVLVPVLIDGLQKIPIPNVLLAATTCQQGRGHLKHLINWFLGRVEALPLDGR